MQILAHRGDTTRAHENTMDAFEAAFTAGASGFEFDVRLSADGVPVIYHNLMIGEHFIADLSCAELQAIPLGENPENCIPTLAQVLDTFAGKTYLEIHLQADSYALVEIVCKLIQQHPQLNNMFELTSFEPMILHAVQERDKSIACDLLFRVERWMSDEMALRLLSDKAKLCQPRGVHLFPNQINTDSIARFHALGLAVHCGVLNEPALFQQIKDLGIEQMLTDNIWLYQDSLDP
jgi:glycerophosphoryl diester phosphodiesterase